MNAYWQMLRHSGMYSLSLVLVRLSGLFLLPVYTRYLTTSDYGTMELLELTSNMLILLIGMRLGDALGYFYFESPDPQRRRRIISTGVIGAFLLSLAGGTLAQLLARPISILVFRTPDQQGYYHVVFATLMCAIPLEVELSYLRVTNRSNLYAAFQVCRSLLAIALYVILLVHFRMGISAWLWGTLITTGLGFAVMSAAVFWRVGWHFDVRLCRQQIAYSLPLAPTGFAMMLVHYGDRFFLVRSASLSVVGVYALAYKLGMLVSYLYEPFSLYWNSQVYGILQLPSGPRIYTRVLTYVTLVLVAAASVVALFSRPLLAVLVAPDYRGAWQYVPLIAGAYVLKCVGEHVRRVFFVEKRTLLETRVVLVGVAVCLCCYATLIPPFKAWGAAAATLAAFSVLFGYGWWLAQRTRGFPFEYSRLLRIALAGAAPAGLVLLLSPDSFWGQVAGGLVGFILFVALFSARGFFTDDERAKGRHLLGKLRGQEAGL